MMLIHVLDDGRLGWQTALFQSYMSLKDRKSKLNTKEWTDLTYGTAEKVAGRFVASSTLERKIHILEWRSALRRAGLEGSEAASLTEKVLDQALNAKPPDRSEAIRYLESLENDIWLIAQTKERWFDEEKENRFWSIFWRIFTISPLKADARASSLQFQQKRRQILIDSFGAQGEALAARNAALESLTPALPPVPNGTCQYCRYRSGREYKFVYKRYVGARSSGGLSYGQTMTTTSYYKVLGSFSVFLCGRCKSKCIAKQMLIGASIFAVCVLLDWLLVTLCRGECTGVGWLDGIIALLGVAFPLLSLLFLIAGQIVMLQSFLEQLGRPKHLGISLSYDQVQ